MSPTPIVATALSKVFHDESRGEVRAVDGIELQCVAGEAFGLLGANGAGKTTTLRMLSTIIKPSSGTIEVMGRDVRRQPVEVRRSLGFYSASTALYPRLTARETLELFAQVNGYAGPLRARVDSLVERFGLGDYADARVEKLSSGMRQKVSIARTVAHDPPIVVFDEPTVGLDVLNAIAMVEAIRSLKSEGKTVVFSTHIMSEAEKLCDRIAIMSGGRILACDTLAGHREATGQHYLEDIFLHHLKGDP